MNIEYTNPRARVCSQKGNPLTLYALGLQGYDFIEGSSIPIKSGIVLNIFTGVKLSWDDTQVIALITPVTNNLFPSMIITQAGTLLESNKDQEIFLTVTGLGANISLLEYGAPIAKINFLKLAEL
jgi:hypothetical protein